MNKRVGFQAVTHELAIADNSQSTAERKNSSQASIFAVSVCVCTYKRPQLLASLLKSLAEQSFCGTFEVIVVDNNPVGDAAEVVESSRRSHPQLNIRYTVELRKGIAFTRNTAVSLAAGEFLAWIDDDEAATARWLELLWKTRLANNMDAVFGPVVPVFPEGSHSWPERSGLFDRPRHLTGTPIDAREARTGNALVKAKWFHGYAQPFDIKLANTGGEDYDFFARIEKEGARFSWCDEAEVFEMVPFERQRLGWLLERRLRGSTYYWRSRSTSKAQAILRAFIGTVTFIILSVAGIFAAPFGIHHAAKLWCRAMGGLGRAVAVSSFQWTGY